jgi:hypothetical protein
VCKNKGKFIVFEKLDCPTYSKERYKKSVSVITVDTINLKVALVVDNHSKRSLY